MLRILFWMAVIVMGSDIGGESKDLSDAPRQPAKGFASKAEGLYQKKSAPPDKGAKPEIDWSVYSRQTVRSFYSPNNECVFFRRYHINSNYVVVVLLISLIVSSVLLVYRSRQMDANPFDAFDREKLKDVYGTHEMAKINSLYERLEARSLIEANDLIERERKKNDELRKLIGIQNQAILNYYPNSFLPFISNEIKKSIEFDTVLFYEYDKKKDVKKVSYYPEGSLDKRAVSGLEYYGDQWIKYSSDITIIDDLERLPDGLHAILSNSRLYNVLIYPIRYNYTFLGIIVFATRKQDYYYIKHKEVLSDLIQTFKPGMYKAYMAQNLPSGK